MRRIQSALPVLVCVLALPLAALFIHPRVELGIVDDWSYLRTAQLLADSGHVVYNGWATAILGWQLYLGALLIKLFGFSFTVARMGTLLVAMATAALMQRLFVRFGAGEWDGAAATLVFLLSPVFMALTFSFMSDVYGVFALISCCYCCVRAVQAQDPRAATTWVCVAALSNAVGGTARQIAWLGVLVMLPCTLWLLRRNRRALWLGGACTVAGWVSVPLFVRWFNRQPFALPERVAIGPVTPHLLVHSALNFGEYYGFELLFLMMPLLVVFAPVIYRNRRTVAVVVLVLLYWAFRLHHLHSANTVNEWEVPYLFNNFWFWGFEYYHAFLGWPPLLITPTVQRVLTALVLIGELGLIAVLFSGRRSASFEVGGSSGAGERELCWRDLLILLVPVTVAYFALLLPRWITVSGLDRYVLFPEFVLLVLAVRVYQRNVQAKLPRGVWVAVAAMALLDTAGMHDAFALFRAQAALLDKVSAAGVPRTAMDGGVQFNGWTEIVTSGYINDPRIVRPAGAYHPQPTVAGRERCHTDNMELTPVVHARYVVSFDPSACGGLSEFGPEVFHTWFGPHTRTLYMVKGPYYGSP